jgi:hypothetical protein
MKNETEMVKRFTEKFPDLYVIESEDEKRQRLRESQSSRKIP